MRHYFLAVLIGLFASGAQAQDCKAIRFDPGESGATINGTAPAEGQVCYTLSVQAGQKVSIKRVGGDENVAITVLDVGDARDEFEFTATSNHVEFLVFQLFRAVTDVDYSVHVQVR